MVHQVEERPDVDSIYMQAVQQMTGHGGWPMTVFLTPEGVPFYGGTYFPPEPKHGLPSFRQLLLGIAMGLILQIAFEGVDEALAVPGADLIPRVLQQVSSRTLPDVLMLDNPDLQQIAASGALSVVTDYGLSLKAAGSITSPDFVFSMIPIPAGPGLPRAAPSVRWRVNFNANAAGTSSRSRAAPRCVSPTPRPPGAAGGPARSWPHAFGT